MGLSFFFLCLLFCIIYLLFWVLNNHKRRKVAFIFTLIVGISLVIYNVFIVDHSIKFIQSNIYPNLYLIENKIEDRDSLNALIKNEIFKKISIEKNIQSLDYYEYTTGNNFMESGTVWFLDHEEDHGGFSTDTFEDYKDYKIASFNAHFCKDDSINYTGIIKFYLKNKIIQTDTINCNNSNK